MTGPQRFRKKPVEIEAMRWTFDTVQAMKAWVGDHCYPDPSTRRLKLFVQANAAWLYLNEGEWVAKDRHGFYPIKDDVFLESYEAVAS